MYDLVFYVQYPYYYPHFLPVSKEAEKNGLKTIYVLSTKQNTELITKIAEDEGLEYIVGDDKIFEIEAKYFIFANIFNETNRLKGKSLFMDHGVGTKYCDYEKALTLFDVVLVEGDYREKTLQQEFPDRQDKIKKVGFSKLDSVINADDDLKDFYFEKYHLDKKKETILYAPTFFPSSIEKMSDEFPLDFKEYNIIVKPHYLSLERKHYKNQQKKFKKWERYDNCIVCSVDEYSLIPFLTICDIMISDESSAIFEFTALDKPVVLNRFLKLRWSYYLNPKKLLKRLDSGIDMYRQIGDNAQNYQQMVELVKDNLKNPLKLSEIRKKYTKDICGEVDGNVSARIIEVLNELK